ncbi:nucleotidyltransferase domain-containing protein [Bdellovibrionota bacterium FG-2]
MPVDSMVKPYMSLLSDLFSSRVRSEILRLLFNEPSVGIYVREIARQSGLALGTIQQDLMKLQSHDLIISRRDGNRLFYYANTHHPLHRDLCNIVSKTVGITPLIRERLAPLKQTGEIDVAFIFGSVAKGKEKSLSDIDLMVIGKLGLRGLLRTLSGLSNHLGRAINPHTITPGEFRKRIKQKDHFLTQVLKETMTFVGGDVNELEKLAR